MRTVPQLVESMTCDGFVVVPEVFSRNQIDAIVAELEAALNSHLTKDSIRSDAGNLYAARNILAVWPPATEVWRQTPTLEILTAILGPDFGLVRGLYFDKPPDRSWTLPWHKDLTIAVQEHRHSKLFTKPTRKAGVPHMEAPLKVLESMATIRIHLDDVTEENGPLQVIPGSHQTGKELRIGNSPAVSVLVRHGDVLVMRPLLAHASGHSKPGTRRHRRILHLEFAASAELPENFCWHEFHPGLPQRLMVDTNS